MMKRRHHLGLLCGCWYRRCGTAQKNLHVSEPTPHADCPGLASSQVKAVSELYDPLSRANYAATGSGLALAIAVRRSCFLLPCSPSCTEHHRPSDWRCGCGR